MSGGLGVAPRLALGVSPKEYGRTFARKLRKRCITKIRWTNSGAHYDIAPEFLCNLEQHAQKNAAPGCAHFTKNQISLTYQNLFAIIISVDSKHSTARTLNMAEQ